MIFNIILAASNTPCIYPIQLSIIKKYYWTTVVICLVSMTSIIFHLVENPTHGMTGIGFSAAVSNFFYRLDVSATILTTITFLFMYLAKYGFTFNVLLNNILFLLGIAVSLTFLYISGMGENDPTTRNIYVITHGIWHITIFLLMGKALKIFF